MEDKVHTNVNLVFDPPQGPQFPAFFADPMEPAPSPQEFKQWPLKASYNLKKLHITANPKMMQPKQNDCQETVDVFFVSPRQIIRKVLIQSSGFPYADCFNMEYKTIFT